MEKETAIKALEAAKTEDEWNAVCDKVKTQGMYPDWWYDAVISSGLAGRKAAMFR